MAKLMFGHSDTGPVTERDLGSVGGGNEPGGQDESSSNDDETLSSCSWYVIVDNATDPR